MGKNYILPEPLFDYIGVSRCIGSYVTHCQHFRKNQLALTLTWLLISFTVEVGVSLRYDSEFL